MRLSYVIVATVSHDTFGYAAQRMDPEQLRRVEIRDVPSPRFSDTYTDPVRVVRARETQTTTTWVGRRGINEILPHQQIRMPWRNRWFGPPPG